jgi:hypothetical protein
MSEYFCWLTYWALVEMLFLWGKRFRFFTLTISCWNPFYICFHISSTFKCHMWKSKMVANKIKEWKSCLSEKNMTTFGSLQPPSTLHENKSESWHKKPPITQKKHTHHPPPSPPPKTQNRKGKLTSPFQNKKSWGSCLHFAFPHWLSMI